MTKIKTNQNDRQKKKISKTFLSVKKINFSVSEETNIK